MKSLLKFALSLLLLCVVITKSDAQAAPKISIQGTLKDANGAAVDDDTYMVEFRLYSVETGGAILWFETASVESAGGIYSHYLGSVTPLDATVFGQTLYLGIKVGAFELTPRTELTYAPYTFVSNTALFAEKVRCSGAVGDVKYSILNPTQFILENGNCWTPMDGGNMFGSKLATYLSTNTKPNASGLFLRAHEYQEGNDPDRTTSSQIATVQPDGLGSHGHGHSLSFSGTTNTAGAHTHSYQRVSTFMDTNDGGSDHSNPNSSTSNQETASSGNHSHTVSGTISGSINSAGGSETRPKNLNLYVYIRIN